MIKDEVGRSFETSCDEPNRLMSSFLYSLKVPKDEISTFKHMILRLVGPPIGFDTQRE